MRKVVRLISLCVLILPLLTACFDAREVDQWVYVHNIGVDKGVSNKLRFTFQISTVVGMGGSGGGGGEGSKSQNPGDFSIISIDAPSFYSGTNMLESSLSRSLNFMHAKYIVVSEDLAREGVERFINSMIRSRQIRRIMHILIVREKAKEFIQSFNPILSTAISKAQEGLMNQKDETGFFMDTNYHHFIKDLKTTYRMPTAPLAAISDFSGYKENGEPPETFKSEGDYYAGELPRSGGNKFEIFGTALFNGDKMVGELNGDETRVLLMARNEFDRGSIAIVDPMNKELRITIDTKTQKKPSIKVDTSGTKPLVQVKLFLEGDIQNIQGPIEYENIKLKPVLENAFKEYMKGILDKTIRKCQDLDVDAFAFGEKAVMHFLTIPEWEEYNWLNKFKDARITTEVEFTIRRTGTIIKTNPSRESKGER